MPQRSREEVLADLISRLGFSYDGAIIGVALAYAAIRSIYQYTSSSKSLQRIREAPTVPIADLRFLCSDENEGEGSDRAHPTDHEQKLVIVRGIVEPKSAIDGSWMKSLRVPTVLVSSECGEKAVVIKRSQTCIYHNWKGIFGWTSDIKAILGKASTKKESTSLRTVPFILVEGGQRPVSNYVIVNMDGSAHPLPLTTVYHQLQPIAASGYTFLQAIFSHEFPVGLLDEEKILPVGKCISAVGICDANNGVPEIKSCKDLPFFLSDLTKDEMVADLVVQTKVLFWSGIVLGSLSLGILGFAIWRKWRERRMLREWRQSDQPTPATGDMEVFQIDADEEGGDVPDGQLCVVCLMRRRRSAFIPCGHLVCCQRCTVSVQCEASPKCPLCRQAIRNAIRVYDS